MGIKCPQKKTSDLKKEKWGQGTSGRFDLRCFYFSPSDRQRSINYADVSITYYSSKIVHHFFLSVFRSLLTLSWLVGGGGRRETTETLL